MRKRRMRLSESKLHSIVRDTVRGVLREGSTDDEVAYKWDEVEELLGSHKMLECIWAYLSEDDIIKILGWFNEDFDIWVDDEDM